MFWACLRLRIFGVATMGTTDKLGIGAFTVGFGAFPFLAFVSCSDTWATSTLHILSVHIYLRAGFCFFFPFYVTMCMTYFSLPVLACLHYLLCALRLLPSRTGSATLNSHLMHI